MKKVCVGGTFDRIHKGHKELLKKAFEIAGKNGKVIIGLSDGDLIKEKANCMDFEERKKRLEEYLNSKDFENYEIVPIYDRYGKTLEEDFDVIVVSEETHHIAEEINRIRKERGMKEMEIVSIPMVLAEDGRPISSSRIKKGEIDENGRCIKD